MKRDMPTALYTVMLKVELNIRYPSSKSLWIVSLTLNHKPVLLIRQIDWLALEVHFSEYYCADNGQHAYCL